MFYTLNFKKLRILLLLVIFLACGLFLANRYFPLSHTKLIYKYAREYGLDPAFVCAVIHAESKFKKDAASSKGASGLMQLTEPTAVWLAAKMNLTDFEYDQIFEPETNISIGCYNLRRLLNQFDGDEQLALAAYNAGEGNVNKWLKNSEYSQDGKTLTNIPFKETREYIKRVEFNIKIYSKILALIGGIYE